MATRGLPTDDQEQAMIRTFIGMLIGVLGSVLTHAADIEGTVIIRHNLTKRKVTAPVSSYDRGATVELGSLQADDPLAFERVHVAIYLEGQLPSKPITVTMDQNHRQFRPDMLVISAGSTVSFPNLDPIFHNVFSLSHAKAFDLGNYPKDQTRTVTFPKPGIIFVNCRLHPNMSAAIVVTPNQWNTRAEPDGHFSLSNVPAGTYQIVAWHKAAGFFRQMVNVTETHGAIVSFTIPLDEHGVALSRR
jgi:plastocyanin